MFKEMSVTWVQVFFFHFSIWEETLPCALYWFNVYGHLQDTKTGMWMI